MSTVITWTSSLVRSPHLPDAVPVVVAREIAYVADANGRQNLTIYLPSDPSTSSLVNKPATSLPTLPARSRPQTLIHIHGGAWRDPLLTSTSIEAAVAHAFSDPDLPIKVIISINYTLSAFPTHATLPYRNMGEGEEGRDASREAVHPDHVKDVRSAMKFLREKWGVGGADEGVLVSGHSCGAWLAFEGILSMVAEEEGKAMKVRAVVGLNGLYDLPDLVQGLGSSHEHLSGVYEDLIGIAFGTDRKVWEMASPSRLDVRALAQRIKDGTAPQVVLIDQSDQDQLVPMNQADTMEKQLRKVEGLRVVRGNRCTGVHAAPWEQGYMIWESVLDVLKLL